MIAAGPARFIAAMRSKGPAEHLTWAEMACKDGTVYPAAWRATRGRDLGVVFERIRALWGKPIGVASVYRTPAHNRRVGGARNSQHVEGRAMDILPPRGVPLEEFQRAIRRLADEMVVDGNDLIGGIGYYPTFCHVDIRGGAGAPLIAWWGKRPTPEVGPVHRNPRRTP